KGSKAIRRRDMVFRMSSSPLKINKMVWDTPKRCPKCGRRMYYNHVSCKYVCESCGYEEIVRWGNEK
ncbi:unnamed protein product, partial [marine sediment metagenome]